MEFNLNEILSGTNSYLFYKNENVKEDKNYKVSIFLPELDENTIFIPFVRQVNFIWENTFLNIEKAILKGARAFFFDEKRYREKQYRELLINLIEKYKDRLDFVLMADETFTAISKLAYYSRTSKLSPKTKIIAVTGSIGKTSTTEMIYSIFSQKHSIYRGKAQINIKIRIMHKFFEVEPDVDIMLFECSGHIKGYLASYSKLLMPDGIVITRAANENLGTYKTIENLTREKSTLMTAMNEEGVAVIDDTPYFRKFGESYCAKKSYVKDDGYELISFTKEGSKFKYKGVEYELPIVGLHQISNAIKAIELAIQMGLSIEEIQSGLKNFENVGNRWIADNYKTGITMVTDCPNNASTDAMIQNIKTFMELYKDAPNKRVVISRIKYLGQFEKQTYLQIAKFLCGLPLDEVILINKETEIIKDYILKNSKIKVKHFDRSDKINKNDPLCKYILETFNFPQALLIKAQHDDNGIDYGQIKDIVREEFKKDLILP